MDSVATLVLRPARAEDAPALARLRDEAIRAACAGRASPHQMRAWRRTPDAVVPVITQRMVRAATRRDDYAVALSDEVLAGFCLTSPAGPAGYVDAIYIHPRYWRRGIGRALLERAEQVMAGQGARH
ncbi:MAG: GNAT family N-acetyltransferase, partial [Alphaproteobacteria bacterium]